MAIRRIDVRINNQMPLRQLQRPFTSATLIAAASRPASPQERHHHTQESRLHSRTEHPASTNPAKPAPVLPTPRSSRHLIERLHAEDAGIAIQHAPAPFHFPSLALLDSLYHSVPAKRRKIPGWQDASMSA